MTSISGSVETLRSARVERIAQMLRSELARLFGMTAEEVDADETFIALGADSLLLLRASRIVRDRFGIRIPFRQFITEINTLNALAAHVERELPPDEENEEPTPAAYAPPAGDARPVQVPVIARDALGGLDAGPEDASLRRILAQQLRVMALQLEAIHGRSSGRTPARASDPPPREEGGAAPSPARAPALGVAAAEPRRETEASEPVEVYTSLTTRQADHVSSLVERVSRRMPESKRRAQAHRPVLADPRGSLRFQLSWKDLCFPLVVERGEGARIWDVDGNEHVDLSMSSGALLFGHSPDFLLEALRTEMGWGLRLGPRPERVGDVVELIRELTGMERLCFVHSRTEAVMLALRLARMVTEREQVAIFAGSDHGMFDGVLARRLELGTQSVRAVPLTPGISVGMLQDLVVLEPWSSASLAFLRAQGTGIAAVVVEPLWNASNARQEEFLRDLGRVCLDAGIALVFDETATGFRSHPGGAQALLGMQADLVMYGGALAAGMPIGVLAGREPYLDAVDGGAWCFGDESAPGVETTLVRGDFFQHPLVLAAAHAALRRLKERGPALQEELNGRASELEARLQLAFDRHDAPVQVERFGSRLSFCFPPAARRMDGELFFYHLREKGVYVGEDHVCHLSTAHTGEELDRVVRAVEDTVRELRAGGFLGAPADGAGPAGAAEPEGVRELPLTPAQKELWALSRASASASRAYNEATAFRFRGSFDPAALRSAIGDLTRRHEALRTYFSLGGEVQRIASGVPLEVPLLDLSGLNGDAEGRLEEILSAEARTLFDMQKAPLLRARIIRMGEEDHILAWTTHHIVTDGWSTGLLLSELRELYSARVQGRAPRLRESKRYSEVVAARARAGTGAERTTRLEYWKERLGDSVEVLSLPSDRPRTAARTYAGRAEHQHLDVELLRRLGALCEAHGATHFGVLLAAFRIFLHRLANQHDIVIGTNVAGQTWDDAGAVGYFVDLLPLRSRLDGETAFSSFLASSSAELMDAIDHRGIPIREVLDELDLSRTLHGTPLVTVVFNQHRVSATVLPFGDAEAERIRVEKETSNFELTVAAVEVEGGLQLEWEYSTDLLDPATIHRWMRYFRTLLDGIVADPEGRISDLPMLTEEERHQLLVAWNETTGTDPGEEGLHTPFERQAAARPEAIALVAAGERLTYHELNDRADRLAAALCGVGVGPEAVVAICAERSVEMVVGILAVLKAGGAYLSLDPTHPADRLAFMLRDARPRALLTQAGLRGALPEFSGPTLLLDGELPAGGNVETRRGGVGGANLAYVIYTSGSTGEPKGVMISHRAIRNRILWAHEAYPLGDSDAVLFKTPFTFDASIWELLLPLWSGARVVVAEPDAHKDPARMVEAIVRHGATVLQLVPSMLQVLLAQHGLEECTSLRLLFSGGEALPVETARSAAERLHVRVVNLYGPTEASIDVTSWPCDGREEGPLVPIGRPITNTRIYIVDGNLRPVPVGVPGEVYATGPGLARGYLARPDLTAERFIPDPFGALPGGRLYRTGDLARYRPDGAIDFLGRVDRQVKLRGVRIEMGEIESVLRRHPAVEAAVVVSRQEGSGDLSLAAYFIPAAGEECTPAELRRYLCQHLPEHMVPSAIVALHEFPRTSSGKLDSKRLPDPDHGSTGGGAGYAPGHVSPRSPVEEIIHEIWAEVLHTRPISVHQRFFDLGGHSLSALQLLARMQTVFGMEVPLRAFFGTPTIAGLAASVERSRGDGTVLQAPPLVPVSRKGSLPLSFAQQRLWILHQLEGDTAAYNLFNLIPLPAGVEIDALEGALTEVVRRHEILRTTFPVGEGIGVQCIHPVEPVKIAIIDFAGHPAGERRAAARRFVGEEVVRPFDLVEGPLLRAALIHTGDVEPALLLVMHHIVSDGWSMGVLQEELAVLHQAWRLGKPSPLPELPVQYADFAQWERSWLQGEVLEAELAYWRGRMAGAPQVIALPTDRPRPPVQSYRGSTRVLQLPGELTDALRHFSHRSSVTLYMALLGAFKVLLRKYGVGDDVVVGTHVAGRSRVEVERLVGFFVNPLVLRTDLSGDPSFAEVVERVRDTALGAFAHQHLPFERVVEELQPERDLSITPLYQVSFDLQQLAPVHEARAARFLTSEVRTVKFDLEVTVAERPEEVLVAIAYSTDLFDGATIVRMLRHFEALLRAALADPGRRLSELTVLGDEEIVRLLQHFQGARREYPTAHTLAEHFERQAEETPERTAVVAGGGGVTYAELNKRANRLARLLRLVGVRRGEIVGILEERGIDFITGVLATLKVGSAYVPLDPSHPVGRLRHMLQDSGISVLLTRSTATARAAGALVDCPALREVVCFDAPAGGAPPVAGLRVRTPEDFGALEASNPEGFRSHPGDPAYMLYTSGSTGLPKGAAIRNDGAVNHIFAEFEVLQLGPELRFLQSAPSSSDISVWQMLAPLVVGGRTVVVDADTVSDPERLLQVLREEAITVIELVPAVLRNLLEHVEGLPAGQRPLPSLRWVMATGEEVPVNLVNAWFRSYPEIRMVNAYGPTEASDDAVQLVLDGPLPDSARSVLIGKPLPNVECHVLDSELRLVPVGVPGELCIGGVAVGNGYFDDPRRTAASFVPSPFARTPGEVMYRTGDRVRWLPDGTLEFLGRIDQQVKIRGFRVELGEVESVAREDPGVRDCAVVVREEGERRRLVAYVVPSAGRVLDVERVLGGLRRSLPEHMVPSAFVSLEAFPLTPAGKVDRKALAADRRVDAEVQETFVPARTPTEEAVAAIWMEVLSLPEVSAEADFFRLGGHSLLAAMVISRVRSSLEVAIPLRRLFEHTTLAGLAAHIDQLRETAPRSQAPALGQVARNTRRVRHVSDGVLETL